MTDIPDNVLDEIEAAFDWVEKLCGDADIRHDHYVELRAYPRGEYEVAGVCEIRKASMFRSALAKLRDARKAEAAAAIRAIPLTETMTPFMRDVIAERVRQVSVEGWTEAHDDEYEPGDMSRAAVCYALHGTPHHEGLYIHGRWKSLVDLFWPWLLEWWKPTTRRRNLVKAGALIIAEGDRLDRSIPLTETKEG